MITNMRCNKKNKASLFSVFLVVYLATFMAFTTSPFSVLAQSSSSNYSIDEFFIGPGGDQNLSSSNYDARATVGDLGSGNYASTNYQLYSGFTTTDVPYIELNVTGATIDMGTLDTLTTGTGTATFSVRSYLSSGYSVHVSGDLPTTAGGATIDGMTAQAASSLGTEQFGMNLVANTSPTTFGANRVHIPSGSFANAEPTNDYDDTNLYKFINGDAVASSSNSDGQTNFTASFIMNVGPITEAGLYQTSITFVATATF